MIPWRLGYRVVMRKLGPQSFSLIMDAPRIGAIVDALFQTH